MKYRVITSWSKAGFDDYGINFVDSYAKYWRSIPIWIFSEDDGLHKKFDPYYYEFIDICPEDSKDYRWQAKKFCHKVFAYTDKRMRDIDWLIWIDADVETFAPVDVEFLRKACPDGTMGSYLGRKDWHHSECGWISFNLKNGAGAFLDRMREVYTSGEIFDYLEWHDSYIFDRVREEIGGNWHNLSEGVPGLHVWDDTILGIKMRHLKGPLRKSGKRPQGLPESYWSGAERA